MRKILLLSGGVVVAFVAAVFVGAAAANTGAPVFYDARYPAPAPLAPSEYDVEEGGVDPVGPGVEEAGTIESPTPPENSKEQPAPPVAPTPTPAPTPGPTPAPTPTPGPGDPTPGPDDGATDPDDGATDPDDSTSGELGPDGPDATFDRGQPDGQAPTPDEQQTWLAFQQIVRECMADAGHEYLYWEWWNPEPGASGGFPAMPTELTPDEVTAWQLALDGDGASGHGYRWQDAGCWGYAVHVTGGTN
jgi:hypothetical protein